MLHRPFTILPLLLFASTALAEQACGEGKDSVAIAEEVLAKPRPWLAMAETEGLNLSLLAFDHYVLKGAYADVTMNTVMRNASLTEWFWDCDNAYVNLVSHPYHGSLYFNAARANGLTFWQSVPYAVGGSLLWEIAGECELPSFSDFAATSVGGAALGEVTHRVSALVLDDSRRGLPRVLTELAAAIVDPARGLNRLFTGRAWRVDPSRSSYHDYSALPVDLSLAVGYRHVGGRTFLPQPSGETRRHDHSMNTPFLDLSIDYGRIVPDGHNRPYDHWAT